MKLLFGLFGAATASFCTQAQVNSFMDAFASSFDPAANMTDPALPAAIMRNISSQLWYANVSEVFPCHECMEPFVEGMLIAQASGDETVDVMLSFIVCARGWIPIEDPTMVEYCSVESYDGLVSAIADSSSRISATDFHTESEYLEAMISSMGTNLSVSDLNASYPCYPCLETLLSQTFICYAGGYCEPDQLVMLLDTFTFCATGRIGVTVPDGNEDDGILGLPLDVIRNSTTTTTAASSSSELSFQAVIAALAVTALIRA